MMKKNYLTLLILALGGSILAGCESEDNSKFEDTKYQAPTVTSCEALTGSIYAGTNLTTTCTLKDKDNRDLSTSTFVLSTVPEITGTIGSFDANTGVAITTMMLPVDAANQTVEFCITPQTDVGDNNVGTSDCISDIAIVEHEAPVAYVDPLPGNIYDSNTVTATYSVVDAAGRDTSLSTVQWLDENDAEMGATTSLTLGLADVDKAIRFCVNPKSEDIGTNTEGEQRCTASVVVQENPSERPPAATDVAFTSVPTLVEAGSLVTGSYTYVDNSGSFNSAEAGSIGQWVDENDGSELKACSSAETLAKTCDYTVAAADVGKALQYCVTPKTDTNLVGATTCSASVDVAGIKVSGSMMFLETLTLEMIGYDSSVADPTTAEWFVDTSLTADLTLDAVRADGKPASGMLLHTGGSFEVAPVQGLKATLATYDGKTGAFTKAGDHSWAAAVAAGDITGAVDANHFVGKEIKVCFDVDSTNRCLNVSEQPAVTDAFYPINGIKGIAPIKELVMGDGTVFHRPLTVEEAAVKQFGAALPDADATTIINGIDWARFNQQVNASELYDDTSTELGAISACRRLEGGLDADSNKTYPWFMPEMGRGGVVHVYQDMADSSLNNVFVKPTSTSVLEKGLGSKILTGSPGRLSASTGWPIDTLEFGTYASASIDGGKKQFYGGQTYKDMNSGSTSWGTWNGKGGYAKSIVSCIKLATP